jgi:hypothetical protein
MVDARGLAGDIGYPMFIIDAREGFVAVGLGGDFVEAFLL